MTAVDQKTAPSQHTTALDEHRDRNADRATLDAIRAQINEHGVEFIYYQIVTVTGRVVAKVVPARHLERNAIKGVNLHRTAMTDLQSDRHGNLLGGGQEAAEFTALPDLDTFAVLPWEPSMARFLCTVYEPDHRPEVGGQPLPTDSRGLLKRAHAAFQQETGLELRTGCEPEMTWTGPGLEVTPRPGQSPAYSLDLLERTRHIFQSVIRYGQALGLNMIEGDYEDPGQIELNFMFDRAELTADRLTTYRMICRQVAREHGVKASFMPKPTTGAMGNGCHHNFSLWRGDQNMLVEPGRTELHLSELGRHALGGVLAHAAGSMVVMGSTVNSYKRYWDVGQFAPSRIDWGMENRTCTVRLSVNGRLEFKLPDAAVNPYLSHTLLLASIKDGLKRKIDQGKPQTGSSHDNDESVFGPLPVTLGEALVAFREDPVVQAALPTELADAYAAVKADEWARFCSYVTDWERAIYEDVLA